MINVSGIHSIFLNFSTFSPNASSKKGIPLPIFPFVEFNTASQIAIGSCEKLKLTRIKYGYTQKQIADKLDLSPSIISSYESGERTPSVEVLLSLSYIYHCSVDYLLGKQSNEKSVIFDVEGLTDKQIAAINALIESIKEDK